ncbi:MAG TPA: translation initiation factor IF-2 [Chthoniobacteraceae bacterium]|nr:translation initiation factor IF-2 [Chthoniobacteraceae bacterium]
MPTKATSKTSTKKAADAKAEAKAKPSPKPAAAADKDSGVKSLLPKITARAAKKPEAEEAKPEAEAKPVAPPKPKEALSLIDEKPKKVRKVATEAEKKSFFTPISRIQAAEQEKEAAPAPETAAPVAASAEPTEEPAMVEEDGKKIIHLKPPIIVRDLAAAMGLKPFQVIGDLMAMNIFVSLNQPVEADVATKVCEKHGFVFEKDRREKGAGVHKVEHKVELPPEMPTRSEDVRKAQAEAASSSTEQTDDSAKKEKVIEFKARAPIVAFMGHVDHGKTTLMDAIRKARVAAGEAGGITQHIGAYSVGYKEQRITFLDTPGHAAFTAMRARGANVTDIVVLIVAADDGIMPQTIEALNHAKAAKVDIIVAITKIDLPGANIEKVKGQLQDRGLAPEDWGGQTIVCPVSAVKGQGVTELLESILLVAEVAELKATDSGPSRATVIEAQVEQGRGPTATVIVRSGTLKVGDPFICGKFDGKVKSLLDDLGKPLKAAGPSTPCKVLGFAGLPNAGDELVVLKNERETKQLAAERQESQRLNKLAAPQRATLESLFDSIAAGQKPTLRIVLKGDVQGSVEAIQTSLGQIDSKKVELDVVHAAVGPINENDVLLATASNAIIIGFNVKVENVAATTAKREGVQIKLYSIIYELLDQAKEAMAGLLEPETREQVIGHAEIKKVFDLTKGTVAGCLVIDGRMQRTARARVTRDRMPIYDGGFHTLRRFQDDVKEVRNGLECGIKLGEFNDYEVGDIIECYLLEKVAQKL